MVGDPGVVDGDIRRVSGERLLDEGAVGPEQHGTAEPVGDPADELVDVGARTNDRSYAVLRATDSKILLGGAASTASGVTT